MLRILQRNCGLTADRNNSDPHTSARRRLLQRLPAVSRSLLAIDWPITTADVTRTLTTVPHQTLRWLLTCSDELLTLFVRREAAQVFVTPVIRFCGHFKLVTFVMCITVTDISIFLSHSVPGAGREMVYRELQIDCVGT